MEAGKLKITFPHMGNSHIGLKCLFQNLGLEVIVPPLPNKKTVELGVRHSPELACLPLKINVGNLIEAVERGADTVVMVGGSGPCRFGYYGNMQKEILDDLGYKVKFIIIQPPQGNWYRVWQDLRQITGKVSLRQLVYSFRFAWRKLKLLDELEKLYLIKRPYERKHGYTKVLYQKGLSAIEKAENIVRLEKEWEIIEDSFRENEWRNDFQPLKIGIVGEIYTVIEPMVNLNLEEVLGQREVEVHRSLFLSHWIKDNLVLRNLPGKKDTTLEDYARPYLGHFVGGHGLESIGQSILYAKDGFDGVIHLGPFTCMPEIVAQSILPSVGKDYCLPILSLSLDEQSGEAGLVTRIEAFIDLLENRRRSGKNESLLGY